MTETTHFPTIQLAFDTPPSLGFLSGTTRDQVEFGIQQLAPRHSLILALLHLDGLDYRDLEAVLNMPRGEAPGAHYAALEALAAALHSTR